MKKTTSKLKEDFIRLLIVGHCTVCESRYYLNSDVSSAFFGGEISDKDIVECIKRDAQILKKRLGNHQCKCSGGDL